MKHILVLDIGSSSVRALLFDDALKLIPGALVAHSHQFSTEPPGASTADARRLQALVEAAIDEILTHPAAGKIAAVGVATFVGNVLGVFGRGQPLTPIYTYADTRSAGAVKELRARVDVEAAHQRTGCPLHTAYLPAKLYSSPNAPHGMGKADSVRWLDFGAYLYEQWFGQALCSYSVAAWSGLLDREKLTWDEEWLPLLKLSTKNLPELADYDQVQVGLAPEYARRWRALRDVPFCLPVGDGAAANVGSGCVDGQHVALTIGTTAALRTVLERVPTVPPGLWCYRVDQRHSLLGGATSEGGNVFAWAKDVLALATQPHPLALSPYDGEGGFGRLVPDVHGLTVLPLLAGERSPGWAADATGAIVGLRLSTSPEDILQALLESVALRLAQIAEQLNAPEDAVIIGSGGALAASPEWVQIISSALNRAIHLSEEGEITARGTALLALRALGKAQLDSFPPTIERVVEPNAGHHEIYKKALERQKALYAVLVEKK